MVQSCLKCHWMVPLLLAAPAVWAAGENGQAAANARLIDLHGTVFDTDGRPAGDAAVWAYPFAPQESNGHRMVNTTADANGRFKLGLVQGEWRVVARKENRSGVANNACGVVAIIPSNPPPPCIVRLAPRGVLRGRLLDRKTDTPIPNGRFWIDECGLVQADQDGRYEVQGLSPEQHHAVALCPGYERNYLLFDTTLRLQADLDLRLTRGVRITGKVIDKTGKPIPTACVGIPTSGKSAAIVALFESSAEDGRFVWDGIGFNHPFYMEASAPGYASQLKDVFVSQGADPSELVFVLEPERQSAPKLATRTVEGLVRGSDGRPVSGATIRWYADHQQERRHETRSDVRGRFTLRYLPDCIGYLEVTSTRHEPAYRAVLQQGDLAGEITLGSARTVRGRVQDSTGQPVEGVMVVPVAADSLQSKCVEPWVWQLHTLTDKNGQFVLNSLPADGFRYDFHSMAGGKLSLAGVQDGMTVTLTGKGAIRGQVLDPQGKPVRDFRVSLALSNCEKTRPAFQPASPEESDAFVTGFYVGLGVDSLGVLYTSDDGTFVLNGLHPKGIEIVVADAPGYGRAFLDCVHTRPVELLPPPAELILQLKPAYPLRVRVVQDAAPDQPIAGAIVDLVACAIPGSSKDVSPSPNFYWGVDDRPTARRPTDAEGWASFPALGFEGAWMIVRAPGFARRCVEWTGSPPEITVRLLPECVITGLITVRGGRQPMSECFVQLERENGKRKELDGIRVGPVDQGRFRFAGLPPGKYMLQVAPSEVERHQRHLYRHEVTLSPGQTYEFSTIGKPCKVVTFDPFGRPIRSGSH